MFVVHLYEPNIAYRKEKSKIRFISSTTYNQLQDRFEKEVKAGKEIIPFEEFSEYAKKHIGVDDLLRELIFGTLLQRMSPDELTFKLQEYGKVKKILHSGSIAYGSQNYVFPLIWKNLLRELKINSKIRGILNHYQEEIQRPNKVENNRYNEDSNREYLSKFLTISIADVHNAIKSRENTELTIELIKETFEQVIFERSKEGAVSL